MILILITLVLFGGMLAYFKIADHYNIIDKPNQRSSHSNVTIRGGGIVFPLGMILYEACYHAISPLMLGGMLLISLISFWDDVKSLPNRVRLFVHLLSVTCLLGSVNAFTTWPIWIIPVAYVLIIGTLNAYNFMDGINGITGAYSLAILSALWYLNCRIVTFTDNNFILCAIIACLVFLFFNFRKKARCFAGDVGSISIGFWIIALLLLVTIQTGTLKYLLFLSVYGVDAILTILHRLWLRQNIFEAHRLHFYQLMANEHNMPHLLVSSLYAILQLLINAVILFTDFGFFSTLLLTCLPLVIIYVAIKPFLMRKAKSVVYEHI